MTFRRSALFAMLLSAAAFGCRRNDSDDNRVRPETTTPTSPGYDTTRPSGSATTGSAQGSLDTTGSTGASGSVGTTEGLNDQGSAIGSDQGTIGGATSGSAGDRAAREGAQRTRSRGGIQGTGSDQGMMGSDTGTMGSDSGMMGSDTGTMGSDTSGTTGTMNTGSNEVDSDEYGSAGSE